MRGRLRAAAWLVYAVGFCGLPFLAPLVGILNPTLGVIVIIGWLVWPFAGWWVARYHIVPHLFSMVRCPGCGYEKEAVARWKCTCGFVDHRERNVLTLRCPKCACYSGCVSCDQCGATILL
jgi:hypothetical protein